LLRRSKKRGLVLRNDFHTQGAAFDLNPDAATAEDHVECLLGGHGDRNFLHRFLASPYNRANQPAASSAELEKFS
jgi:hypothetical protein